MNKNAIPFWAQPTSKLKFHSTEEQKIKGETMKESLGLGKKSYGTETDTETQSWFPSYSNHIILISVHLYFFFSSQLCRPFYGKYK